MWRRIVGWTVVVVIGVTATLFATRHFLQPMNTDLSVVGQGQPALVLAYENFSPESGAALNQLNRIKGDYQQLMAFAVADLGTPEGKAFARRFNLVDGVAVFLSATGQPLQVSVLSNEEQALRNMLDEKLALAGIVR